MTFARIASNARKALLLCHILPGAEFKYGSKEDKSTVFMMHIVRGESPRSNDQITEEEALAETTYSKVFSAGGSIIKQEVYRQNQVVRVSYWEPDESGIRARVALHLAFYSKVPFRIYITQGRVDDLGNQPCMEFDPNGILIGYSS